MTDPSFVEVVFPIPVDESFTYLNPGISPLEPGMRVEAPLGRRARLAGYVIRTLEEAPASIDPARLRPILRRIDTESLFGPDTLELARWLSRMYHCSLGEALSAMLPSARRERGEASEEFEEIELGREARTLTPGQSAALEGILAQPAGMSYLYGPTGTGKTEVFLQLAEKTLAEGRSVIYLVPEIALTHQVEKDARNRFGPQCAIIHSRLTPARKLAEWRRIMAGDARIVIGARSAIFAPIPELGLIIIDEEHDSGYKSGTTPRYHARQVAMFRARQTGARLVMGSATPSPEAWQACRDGFMRRFDLAIRPAGGAFPSIHVVDMRGTSQLISEPLAEALRDARRDCRQSILFLNRRGFARTLTCQTCGTELICRHCAVPLTWHKSSGQLICHYCGYHESRPPACPSCGSLDLGWATYGTERIEEELRSRFPDFSLARLDTDTTAARGVLESTLKAFGEGNIDVLIGTQMVAKGLNFPGVRVVGILAADQGLAMPDFRAAERVFSLIVQVAGRAGRHRPDGQVFLQTRKPDHPLIQRAAEGDVPEFLEQELAMRRQLGFPPAVRLARLVFRSKIAPAARTAAHRAADLAYQLQRQLPKGQVGILGPSECILSVIADNWRWQLILRSRSLGHLQALIHQLRTSLELPSSVYMEIDIDPLQML